MPREKWSLCAKHSRRLTVETLRKLCNDPLSDRFAALRAELLASLNRCVAVRAELGTACRLRCELNGLSWLLRLHGGFVLPEEGLYARREEVIDDYYVE